MNKRNWMPLLLLLLASALQAGDAAVPAEEITRGISLAATSAKDFSVQPKASFAWKAEGREIFQDERLENSGIQAAIESNIRQQLNSLGYTFVESAAAADYLIGYAAALEKDMTDEVMLSRFGVLPGHPALPQSQTRFERGSLVLYLIDRANEQVTWRCAAQAAVDFDAESGQRNQRIEAVINSMLQTLPTAD